MKFLLQKVEGRLIYDFAYRLLDGIEIANKFNGAGIEVAYCESVPTNNLYKEFVPIGSLEFVYAFLGVHHHIDARNIIPINIPVELRTPEFLNRELTFTNVPTKLGAFVKSATKYKGLVTLYDGTPLPTDNYMVSDYIDIQSEFRVFVMNGMILDVRRYCGDVFVLPSEQAIKDMIYSYKSAPPSYTLDVAVTSDGATVILEVHPLVSCGLYGFTQEHYLPYMMYQGFRWLQTEARAQASK